MYKMPYVKKSIYKKKVYKKQNYRKRSTLNNKIRRIAKQVTLREQETKHHVVNYGTFQLFHNVSRRIADNLLNVAQGTRDGDLQSRIGDKITLRGVKLYMNFEQFSDRPNVTFRVWVVKGRDNVLGGGVPTRSITGHLMMDPIDTEKATVVATRMFKFNQNNDFNTSNQKRVNNTRKMWIPLKNVHYQFAGDNASQGKFYDMAWYIAAYDAMNSLITDNIAQVEVSSELFFKDA